ncbi:hypothetical protein BH10PSE3_BH10PSE3_10930 [soil metagenome]
MLDIEETFGATEVIEVGGNKVLSLKGHFDNKAPGVGDQFLTEYRTYDRNYFDLRASKQKLSGSIAQAKVDFSPKNALDVGSGSGNSVFALAELYPEVPIIASDLSPYMVSLVDERAVEFRCDNRVRSIVANASAMKPKACSFDLVVGSSMLHHLVDPRPMLENMLEALCPGGLAIFYEPLQAGYFIVRQAMLQILRERHHHAPLPDKLVAGLEIFILGINVVSEEARLNPILPHLDDKWLFTRKFFERAADALGCKMYTQASDISSHAFRDKVKGLMRGVSPEGYVPPDWIEDILASYDEHIGPDLREEFAMESSLVFAKP